MRVFLLICALAIFLIPFSAAATIPLEVREAAGIAREGEIVQTGVPLTRALGVMDTGSLGVTDAQGNRVPAQFKVLSRWDGGPNDVASPIQWVLVIFPASVPANQIARYNLVTGVAAGPAPAVPLAITQNGQEITVNTGEATFVIGGHSLFKEVRSKDGSLLVSGGSMTADINGQSGTADTIREARIRQQGPLSAVVTVTGTYPLSFGDSPSGAISYLRRYEFEAGSPTAVVRHVVTWEGSHNGKSWWDTSQPTGFNVIEGDRIRNLLDLQFTPSDALLVGSRGSTVTQAFGSTELALRTLLRRQGTYVARFEPRKYEITAGATVLEAGSRDGYAQTGVLADGGMVAARGSQGTIAVALDHMHNYEPQALRITPDGDLAIDIADDKFRLAYRQGLFATLAVAALPPGASRADLDREVWAPLNKPLRALAPAQWFADSEAFIDAFPAGTLPAEYAAYDTKMKETLDHTLLRQEQEGLHGLLTTGLWPRYWGESYSKPSSPAGEIGNGDWDAVFMKSTWTDYYSTTHTAGVWSLRSGEVQYLDELVEPAALRTVHTHILQGSPSDTYFYIGWGSAGYNGYRSDFNTKHHYWDNTYLYYFLTGDEQVVDIITRGAKSHRNWQLSRADRWTVISAPSALWLMAHRFIGHTAEDPATAQAHREHFLNSAQKIISDHYAELSYNGNTYGFLMGEGPNANPFTMDSAWTLMGFDLHNVYWLMVMTGDAPVGQEQIRPSRVIKNIAKTEAEIYTAPDLKKKDGTLMGGDGTPSGNWARNIEVNYTGPRIGGSIVHLYWVPQTNVWLLYSGDKPLMAASFAQAAALGGDPSVQQMSKALIDYSLSIWGTAVLGKIAGLGIERVHEAVALQMPSSSGCLDECSPAGAVACTQDGSGTRTCGNYDSDACLEWDQGSACPAGQACQNGACVSVPACGDGTCNGDETCTTCSGDCGACAPYCGDSSCNGIETCLSCSADCGACAGTMAFEAESMTLNGYVTETKETPIVYSGIRLSTASGTATAQFTDASGQYDAIITYIAESDGNPRLRLLRDGEVLDEFTYPTATAAEGLELLQRTVTGVTIASGDLLVLEGFAHSGAFARLDRLELRPLQSGPVPQAPTMLHAQWLSSTEALLTWVDNAHDETKHIVLRSTNGSAYEIAAELGKEVDSVVLTGLNSFQPHSFRVRAANGNGASEPSEVSVS